MISFSTIGLVIFLWIFISAIFSAINQSDSIKYHLKHYFYYGYVSTCSFLWIPYFACRPKNVVNLFTASRVLGPFVTYMLGLNWELRGAKNFPSKSVIIIANHQSSLDILGMFAIWHKMGRTTVIAKKELLYSGPFGLAAWLCGLVFINKRSVTEFKELMEKEMLKLKAEGIKLFVFPEGTRRCTGKIHEFKKGAFHLAIQTKTPILPLVFSSYETFLDDKREILSPGNIIIEVLPEIPTDKYSQDDVDKLIEETRKAMIAAFDKNSLEIKQRD